MHYRNGREAKNGDKVFQIGFDGQPSSLGILHSAVPGSEYCNGSIAPIHSPGACLVDCIHVDDLMEILKEKGLHVRPEGK